MRKKLRIGEGSRRRPPGGKNRRDGGIVAVLTNKTTHIHFQTRNWPDHAFGPLGSTPLWALAEQLDRKWTSQNHPSNIPVINR